MNFDAAGDLASGRMAITGPVVPIAFCTSCRPAMGMAQCGSILATTCRTSCPEVCAFDMARRSYSVQWSADLFDPLPAEVFAAGSLVFVDLPAIFLPLVLLFFGAVVNS